MASRVRLSRSASVTPTQGGVVLRSDLGTFEVGGADVRVFLEALLPLLDGSRDRDEVAAALEGFSRRSVLAFLELLEAKGLVEAAPEVGSPLEERWRGQEEFFRKWSRSPETMMRKLADARVLLIGLSPWGATAAGELAAAGVGRIDVLDGEAADGEGGSARCAALVRTLAEVSPWCHVTTAPMTRTPEGELALDGGAGLVRDGDRAAALVRDGERAPAPGAGLDLVIGAARGVEASVLRSVARFAQASGLVSVYGDFDGISGLVGPVVVPGETACWSCVREPQFVCFPPLAGSAEGRSPRSPGGDPVSAMTALLGHLLALEAIKLLSGYARSGLTGRLLVQNFITLETTVHTAVRFPQCGVCGLR